MLSILALFVAAALFHGSQNDLAAHARLVASDPPAGSALASMPASFDLTFNENFDLGLSDFRLTDATGQVLKLSDPVIDPNDSTLLTLTYEGDELAPGVYTIIWRVLSSVDGHVTSGSIPFSVGTGESPAVSASGAENPPWWQIIPRWLELSGWALLAGLAGFGLINFATLQREDAVARRLVVRRWKSAWYFAFTIALAGMLAGIVAQTLRIEGRSSLAVPEASALGNVLAETDYGRGWMLRLAMGIVLLFVIGLAPTLGKRLHWGALAVLGVSGIATISATGHAAGEPRKVLAVLVDMTHMTSAGIWIGGLLTIALIIVVRSGGERSGVSGTAGPLVSNHSKTSLVAMAVIVATGVVSASFHIGGFRSFRTEDYGITLLIKIALLLVVLVAAAINLLVLLPRMRAFLKAGDLHAAARETRSVGVVSAFETAIVTLILLATAILTVVAPADYPLSVDVAGRASVVDETLTASDLELNIRADLRGNPGDAFEIQVRDSEGTVPADMQRVIIETALLDGPEAGLGDRFDAEQVDGEQGTYAFAASRLGLEGSWELNVIVRRAGLEDVEAPIVVDTRGSAPGQPRLVDDTWILPKMTLPAWGFLALAVITIGAGLAGLRRLTGMEPVASGVLLAMCVLIASGFAISATRQTIPVTAGHDLANPVEFGDVSVRQGESLFTANCLLCHGADGRGRATEGMSHSENEADLTDRAARKQSDGDLFTSIAEGVAATDMLAFDEALTDEEIWSLVNYIRHLQQEPAG
ncbi:MAG: copper resistance protein CopC [Thermomicrobiales bacterium]